MATQQNATSQDSQTQSNAITRHSEYYFEDGNIILLVQNTLFNVHRGVLLRHSEVFCSLFSLPQPKSEHMEGSKDSHPVRLEHVSCVDFERLLWILYPPIMGELKPETLLEWLSILNLSSKWVFEGVRNLAIREIEKLATEPLDRIVISLQYDIKTDWLLPAYVALCQRPTPLALTEATRINSLEIVTRLAQAREAVQKSIWAHEHDMAGPHYWVPPHLHNATVMAAQQQSVTQGLTPQELLEHIRLPPAEKQRREHMTIVAKFFDLPVPPFSPTSKPVTSSRVW